MITGNTEPTLTITAYADEAQALQRTHAFLKGCRARSPQA
jgi:hypothetical protein